MANYSLVVNSKFRPFEYQELVAPVLLATQAHHELEDKYADLATKASIWDGLTEGSKKAHKMYTDYARALEEAADELSRYGLTPTSRQAMLNMRSRYGKEIVPIENAYKTRQEQIEQQTRAMQANPTLMVSRKASDTSLDEYLANPALSYQSYNGNLIEKQVADQASHLAKELRNYGDGKRLDSFTKTFLQEHGFTSQEVLDAINNPQSGSPVLRAIVDSAIRASGVTESWADNALARANYHANMGLWGAIGETSAAHYEDKAASYAAQLANSKSLARYSRTLEGQGGGDRLSMYDVSPTSYYSEDEVTKANDTLSKQLDKWRRKGYFDGSGNLTDIGRRALTDTYTMGAREKSYQDTEFKKWAKDKDVVVSPYAAVNPGQGRPYQYLENYYKRIRAAIDNGQLATGAANFQVYRQRLAGDDRKLIADNIYNIIGKDGKIYEAGKLVDGTITKGKGYTAAEFAEEIGGYNVDKKNSPSNILYMINSPVSGQQGQQLIELVNGKKFLIPNGEQFFGSDTYADLIDANMRVRGAESRAEVATNLNRANNYMAAPLTTVKGTDIKPNEGTSTIDLINILEGGGE